MLGDIVVRPFAGEDRGVLTIATPNIVVASAPFDDVVSAICKQIVAAIAAANEVIAFTRSDEDALRLALGVETVVVGRATEVDVLDAGFI